MNFRRNIFKDVFIKLGKGRPLEIWFSGKPGVGEYKLFYSNGQLLKHMLFNKKGNTDGEFKTWDRRGKLMAHLLYKDGKFIEDLR